MYAACGNGSVPEKLTGLLKETVASGVPVVIATRCGGGIVVLSEAMTAVNGFIPAGPLNPQKAKILEAMTAVNGFIPAGPLNPQKAKILLQLALTKTSDVNEILRIFASFL